MSLVRFIPLFILLLVSLRGNATLLPHSTFAITGAITTGTTSITPPAWSLSYTDLTRKGVITFGVDHHYTSIISQSKTEITVSVEKYSTYSALTPTSTETKTMTVYYYPLDSASYVDENTLTFDNVEKLKVTITQIKVNGVVQSTLPGNLYLKGDVFVDRIYDFLPQVGFSAYNLTTGLPVDIDCDEVNDEIIVSWDAVPGAEEYQLEWTFINTIDVLPADIPNLKVDFHTNSTRISTTDLSYRVSMVFDKGVVAFRVRAVGRSLIDPSKLLFSTWSSSDGLIALSTISAAAKYQITSAYDVKKNWQYTATYAEEGKKKEVVSFFDGSLRNRQMVTKMSSDQNAIVGETIYDHQGRATIQVLPVPVVAPDCEVTDTENSLKFYPNFNRNLSNTQYSKVDFDLINLSDSCNPAQIGAMNPNSGASNYYSSSNPNINASQGYIPSAEMYPFSQTEYMPDNTGRIRRKGGVGADFQLGTGHETFYYYAHPFQEQLDRLFGSEVGDASHYQKNMVVDPNGQVSVSYLDQEGRTIATSLAGQAPNNLSALPSAAAVAPLSVDLFAKDANGNSTSNKLSSDGVSKVFNQTISLSSVSDVTITYDIAVGPYSNDCIDVCFNCVYDLSIEVRDLCGELVSPPELANRLSGRFTVIDDSLVFQTDCAPYSFNNTFVIEDLPVGTYQVSKTLTVNQEALDAYMDMYTDPTSGINTCIEDYTNILEQVGESSNIDDCLEDFSCAECVTNLGSLLEYINAGGTEDQYNAELEACNLPCKAASYYENMRNILMVDVKPNGQYGEYLNNLNQVQPSIFPLSVLNQGNSLPKSPNAHWRNPRYDVEATIQNYYFDEDGVTISRIMLDNVTFSGSTITGSVPAIQPALTLGTHVFLDPVSGNYYTYPQYLLNLSDFVSYYNVNPYWANSLVYYHPEYNMLMTYKSFYTKVNASDPFSSESFDQEMMSVNTWADAITAGFINPSYATVGVTSRLNNILTINGTYPWDPFSNYVNPSGMNAKVFNYITINGVNYSMMEAAAMMNRGGNNLIGTTPSAADLDWGKDILTNTPTQNTQLRNEEWMTFRGLYLAAKQELQMNVARTNALGSTNPGYNECIGNLDFNPFAYNFLQITPFTPPYWGGQFLNAAQPCAAYTYELYKYKQIRFGTTLANVNSDPSQIAYQQYILTGQCPIASTFERILSESASTGVLDDNGFTVNLSSLSGLILSMQDFETPVSMPTLTWNQVTNTSTILEVEWEEAGNTFGTFKLEKDPGSMTYNWSDIISFGNLHFTGLTGSLYEFTVVAQVNISGTLYTQHLSGNTTFKIGNCTFPDVCKKNDFGKALESLTNVLAQMGTLTSTSLVSLNVTPYSGFINNAVKYTVNPTYAGATIQWKYNSTIPGFELTDGVKTIRIKILSTNPSSFGLGSLSSIASVTEMVPGPNNTMELVCNDASGNYLVTLSCDLIRSDNVMIPVGECGLDDAILCTGLEYDTYDDLMAVLKFSLENQNEPFNLYNTPLWTSVLNSQLPSTPTTIVGDVDNATGDTLTYDLPGSCDLVLTYLGSNPNFNYNNITSVYDIKLLESNYYGSYNKFRIYVTYSYGGVTYRDSIDGNSCFELKICEGCTEPAGNAGQGPASSEQTDGIIDFGSLNDELSTEIDNNSEMYCLDIYEDYLSIYNLAIDTMTALGCSNPQAALPLIPYSTFVAMNLCCESGFMEVSSLITKLLAITLSPSCTPTVPKVDRQECLPLNDENAPYCAKVYYEYTKAVNFFNTYAPWPNANNIDLTTAAQTSFSCECFANYLTYLFEYITASATENLSHPMSIADYCAQMTDEPQNSCSLEYDQYVATTQNFNAQSGPGAPLPILDYDVFVDKGLCICVDEYCSELNLGLNGLLSAGVPDLLEYCLSDPEVPCVLDTPTVNFDSFDMPFSDPCTEFYQSNNEVNAQIAYNEQIQLLQTQLGTEYIKHCMSAVENLSMTYNEIEHHFTLYYYDQAGNLIKTVPPEGVELIDVSNTTIKNAIKADRLNNTHQVITNHRMATTYLYNSLNQLVAKNMSDQDAMEVFELTLPNGLPVGLSTTAIQMVDANQGYLSGYMDAPAAPMLNRGYLYKTTNGGLNWTRVTNTLGSDLKEVKMASATVGYAIGTGGIALLTKDGGQNWDLINTSLTSDLSAIEVVGTDAYVLERIGGQIRKITSAGVVSAYGTPPTGAYPVVVWKDFTLQGNITNMIGIVYLVTLTESSVNYDASIVSNTATTYVVDKTLVGNLGAMSFVNANDGYIAGADGNISFINGNTTSAYRQQLKLSGTAGLIDQIFMLDASKGIARVTENGVKVIRKTTDGGLTWTALSDDYTNANLSFIRRTGTTLEVMLQGNTGAPLNKCYTKNILISSTGAFGEIDQTPALPQTFNFEVTATYNDGTNVTYFGIGLSGGNYKLYRSNTFTGMSADITYTDVSLLGTSSIIPKEMVIVKNGSGVGVEVLATNGIIYRAKSVGAISGAYDPFAAVSGTNNAFVSLDKITISALDYVVAYRSTDKRIYGKAGTSSGPYYYYNTTLNPGTSTIAKLAVHGSNITIAGTFGGLFTAPSVTAIPASNGALSLTFTDRTQHRLTGMTSLRKTASAILLTGQNGQVFTRPVTASVSTINLRPIGSTSNVTTANEYVSSSIAYYLVAGADGLLATLKSSTWGLEPALYTTTGTKVSDHSAANDINDIAVNGLAVYLVGENGSAYYTANIATDFFIPSASSTSNTLQGVDFITGFATKAMAVGKSSEVVRFNTTFGTRINRVFSGKMNDVHFENGLFGTVIGDYYFIRSTVDGGVSWKINVPSTSVGTTGLTKVWTKSKPNGQHFAVVGAVNNVIKVDNGVLTMTGISGTVNDIQFAKTDPLFGYILFNNTFAKIQLTPSGVTYNLPGSYPAVYTASNPLRGLHVFENKSAVMVGDAGKVHYYRLSTNTNYALATVSGVTFRDVYFLDNKIGLAVGNTGAIYRLNSPNNDNVTHDILASGFTATNQLFTDPLAIAPSLYNIVAIAFSSQNTAIYGGNFLTTANANANQALVRNLKFESGLYSAKFYYDRLGRVVVSQNSRQWGSSETVSDDKYSYTLYDALGRVYETGEMSSNGDGGPIFADIFGTNVGGMSVPNVIDDAKLAAWLNYDPTFSRKEVTKSYYDKTNTLISSEVTSLSSINISTQRKRIVHVTYSEIYSPNANEYDQATHYDYDIHGNVKTLYQDNRLIKDMTGIGDHRLKRLDYIYDLISGNIHRIDYQTGSSDQWHHAYIYDSDNRITDVYTTNETPLTTVSSSISSIQNEPELNTFWDREIKYEYYEHGQLSRSIIGAQKVQGVDYIYTLQGWVKGVNSNTLDVNRDPGMDGASLAANHEVAKDVYGYSLHYFDGDYTGIGGNNSFIANQSASDLEINSNDLYNGNVGRMVTTITNPDTRDVLPLGNAYKYDQLNRIKESNSFDNLNIGSNGWGNGQTAKYHNAFTYDANGNIATQVRYDGASTPELIDNLIYKYKDLQGNIGTLNPKKHNRLYSVNDTKDYDSMDIDPGQGLNNYTYDAEGRLIGDAQEFISSITWRADGKVKKITRTPGSGKENVSFDYDGLGHRIAKHTYTDANVLEKSTYYILDARGNTVSVYERSINTDASSISYTQTEKHIYGAARLGLHTERIHLLGTQNDTYSMSNIQHHIGNKSYELSNHLGNILTVISDKVIPHNNGGSVDYYLADIRQATDYSPFGVILKGRNFEPDPYVESFPTVQTIYSTDFENPTVTTVGSTTTIDGWWHYSSTTLSLDNTATQRLKVVSTNGAHGAHQFFTVATGVSHTLSVKIDKGTASVVNILVFYNCPSMSSVTGSAYTVVPANSNGTYTLNFTSTTGYIFVQIRQSGTYYLDDISIVNNAATGTMTHSLVYRYGFQSQERDDEIKGAGNSMNFEYRMHDPRIGRFFAIDPLAIDYPHYTPYSFSGNKVIHAIELEGLEEQVLSDGNTINKGPAVFPPNSTLLSITMDEVAAQIALGKFDDAMKVIVDNYKLKDISPNFTFNVDNSVGLGIFTTSGNVAAGATQNIKTSGQTLTLISQNKNMASLLILCLAHEVVHVYQRSELVMTSHDEREFLAYHFTLFPNNSVLQERMKADPNFKWDIKFDASAFQTDDANRNLFISKATKYYNNLSPELQQKYASFMADVNNLKADKNYVPASSTSAPANGTAPPANQTGPLKEDGTF